MIKKITITLILFTSLNYAYCQNKLRVVKIGNESFIEISLETIIKFLNQPMSNWEKLMKQNGYKLMGDSEGIITYSKGKIGEQIQAIAKNRDGVVSIDWYDYIDKTKILTKLEKSIESYSLTKKGSLKYYQYKNYIIGIESIENETYVFERVLIKHK